MLLLHYKIFLVSAKKCKRGKRGGGERGEAGGQEVNTSEDFVETFLDFMEHQGSFLEQGVKYVQR